MAVHPSCDSQVMVRCSTPGCLKKATWGTLKGTKVEVLFCPDHKGENKALVEATTIRKRLQRGDGVLPVSVHPVDNDDDTSRRARGGRAEGEPVSAILIVCYDTDGLVFC